MTTAPGKRKLPNDIEVGIKRPKISEQEVTSLNSSPYPDNFHVGQAIGNGSCFFDSFRQGLEQQKGIEVTVEQLRNDCKEFAQKNPPGWFTNAIVNSYDNNGQRRSETVDDYQANIMNDSRWGDPEVEGRVLCGKYGVKLHIIEDHSYFKSLQRRVSRDEDGFDANIKQAIMDSNSNEALAEALRKSNSDEARKLLGDVIERSDLTHTHCLIDSSGSLPADDIDYDDQSTIHVINEGSAHFEPLLDINKNLARQIREQQQEQNDLSLAREIQEQEDFLLAKKLQVEEILEYFNISKDSPQRAKVEERFDELLKENPEGKIHDVVEQCVSDIKQYIQRSEEQNSLSPSCGMEEPRVTSHQQQLVK
ncbi:MAG: hypothetical protein ACR5K9_01260 [Wolbachia sp.]